MGNLSKMYGAIAGAILARVVLNWTGLDVAALGVGGEFTELVTLGVEAGVTAIGGAIAGAVTYFFPPNKASGS